MSELRFSDGITIDTSGTMRVIRKSDGFYIVGQGMCCPVSSIEEGQRIIARFMVKSTILVFLIVKFPLISSIF